MSAIDCIVEIITRNYSATGNDLDDVIHEEIDHYVTNNSISENVDIINEYYDDIYDAIVSYKMQYGNVDFRDKAHFYACMAYECLRVDVIDNHYDNIKNDEN